MVPPFPLATVGHPTPTCLVTATGFSRTALLSSGHEDPERSVTGALRRPPRLVGGRGGVRRPAPWEPDRPPDPAPGRLLDPGHVPTVGLTAGYLEILRHHGSLGRGARCHMSIARSVVRAVALAATSATPRIPGPSLCALASARWTTARGASGLITAGGVALPPRFFVPPCFLAVFSGVTDRLGAAPVHSAGSAVQAAAGCETGTLLEPVRVPRTCPVSSRGLGLQVQCRGRGSHVRPWPG